MRTQTLAAGLLAPIIGVTVGVGVLGLLGRDPGSLFGSSSHFASWLVAILLVGTPVAWLLELALGIPLYRWMLRRNVITMGPVLLTAVVGGILALIVPLIFFFAGEVTLEAVGIACLLGGTGGLATGLAFWIISGWGRPIPAV